jgi:glycosyltransferase involved in cell wall biosynthesis
MIEKHLKVAFFTARYSHSGVPLAQIRLAKLFKRKGYEIDFIFGYIPDDIQLPILKDFNVINFNKSRVIRLFGNITKYLSKAKPDIIISAEDHLNAVVLLCARIVRSKAKISVSSRVTPFDTYSNKIFTKRWFLKYFMKFVESRATALVCVSKDMVKQYRTIFKNSRHQCIYNVVNDASSQQRISEAVDEEWLIHKQTPVIVSAGRLAPEKGLPDLVMAIKELSKRRDVRLLMLGEGPMRSEVEALIESENLEDVIKLVGFQENPLKYYSKADVFVLSSYVEGLPNVLVEAMMCGCTPVSTNCPTGPEEVLQNEKYGYLVPVHDPIGMAKGIEKALDNPILPEVLALGVNDFTEEAVFRKYQEALHL